MDEIARIVEFVEYACRLILVDGMVETMSRELDTRKVRIYWISGQNTLRIDIGNRKNDDV